MITDKIAFFQKYLSINTSHPNPDYSSVFELFKNQADSDGLEYFFINVSSGRKVMIIFLQGSDRALPALALNHHIDVVPASYEQGWKYPPFAATIDHENIYGRGTQDMKGVGFIHYAALVQAKKNNAIPKRSTYLLLVPDEEIGGFSGVGELVKTDEFKNLNIGYVLDEGMPSGNQEMLYIKVSERKPLQVTVTAQGPMAHGSLLLAENAVHNLITFLSRIIDLHREQQGQVGSKMPGQLLSLNITSLQAGIFHGQNVAFNVIPHQAQATIDIRVPCHTKISDVTSLFEKTLEPFKTLTYSIHACVQDADLCEQYKNDFYDVLTQAVRTSGFQVHPYFFEATSDLRFYKEQGIDGFGLTPFTCTANLHGVNEYVRISDLDQGCAVIYNLLKAFCY